MENRINEMRTLSQVMEKLRIKRIDNEFRLENGAFVTGNGKNYQPKDLTIVKTYRFEGDSDPSDSSILYLIEANDGLTGYSIDAYGVYSNHDQDYDEFVRKIKIMDREQQLAFSLD